MFQEPTAKQHFVPKFYLKNFADTNGLLQIFDKEHRRLAEPKAYQAVGFEKYFYATNTGVLDEVSQPVEDWLQSIEKPIADELPRIIGVLLGNGPISDDDKYTLSVLMSLLWLRSPGMRAQLAQMETNLQKQLMRLRAPGEINRFVTDTGTVLTEKERAYLIDVFDKGKYDLKYNNADHLRFMIEYLGADSAGFANMFFGMRWRVCLARGTERFVTTDSPVIEWFPPPTTFYGTPFSCRNKYFALTPTIMIEALPPSESKASKHIKRDTLYADRDDEVKIYNMLLVSHGVDYAYTGERRIAEWLVDRANNPGPLQRTYYEKYHRAWDEYRVQMKHSRGW